MRLKVFSALLALALLPSQFLFGIPDRPRFAQENSDLKADPAARFGTLPNGLRYVVMANREPKDRASLRLVVMAGALQEEENQRGLAHYLEHMAFNGSTHYAPGTLVEFFQRMGMSFGGDTNAYTSFDHTTYMIELPESKPAVTEEGFRVFSDFAGGLLLQDKEVDKERGIILSEKRARDSVEYRQFVAEMDFVLGETRIPKRLPIGLAPVIEEAKRDRFVSFYNTWYRPERMAVVAVGDFDPAVIEAQIKNAFEPLYARAEARANPDMGQVACPQKVNALFHHEAEASATTVSIHEVAPYSLEPDTAAKRLQDLPRDLAVSMLNRRLSILAKKEGAPFTRGTADVAEQFDLFRDASIELVCKPENWNGALEVAEQELRRALQFGFQPAEFAEAVANFRNELDQAVKTASTRRSENLTRELIQALVHGEVFTSPTDDRTLFSPALDKLTPEDCSEALRHAFAASSRFIYVAGNTQIDGPDTAATIATAYAKSEAVVLAAPEKIAQADFGYTDFGPSGKVVEKKHVEDLDLWLVTFANGVRLNIKKTDFEAGQIRIGLRVGAGELIEPRDKPGLAFYTNATFLAGGLGKHSADELHRILAGKTVARDFGVGTDALFFSGATNRDDLLLQFQLLAASLTDPGYRPEAARLAQKGFEQLYRKLDHTPEGPLQREVPHLLAGGDPRFGIPEQKDLLARTQAESKAWLTAQLHDGPVEIAAAGDLDIDAVIQAVAQTFGALPARQPKPAYEAERQVAYPSPFGREFQVATEIPKGCVALYWPTTDARDIHVTRRLHLLADVLDDRLRVKIREQLGASYSPRALSDSSDTYRNFGYIVAYVTVDPAKAAQISAAALEVAADIVKNGVTADELERAKKPFLTALRESARTNAYWLGAVLCSAQEFPERLEWCRSRYSDSEAISAADLNDLARKYLTESRSIRITVVPAQK